MATRLRPACPGDAGLVLRLEEEGMRAYAQALWGAWRPSATPENLSLDGHRIVVADGADVGCLAVEHHAGHRRLRKLYIAVGARNQGIGAWSLNRVVSEAFAGGLFVRVSVLVTNPAIRFYLREGFVHSGGTAERRFLERHPDGSIASGVSPDTSR